MKFLLTKQIPCGRYEVANCTRCDPDPEKERCIECKSGMFPFVAGTECYPCDHEKYGQVGCEGNCDSSKYSTIKNVLCDKCKEEYYNVEGFCLNCSDSSPYCLKCSYEAAPGSDQKIFKCLECINNTYRVSDIDGKCRPCSLPSKCVKCRFVPGSNAVECIKCIDGYYPLNGVCNKCHKYTKSIINGECLYDYCPNTTYHNILNYCSCFRGYALTPEYTCIPCTQNCNECRYVLNTAKCFSCIKYYVLTPQDICIRCPSSCPTCEYIAQNEFKCTSCDNGFGLLNYKCISCGEHCISCTFPDNKVKCTKCKAPYILTDKQICELLSIPAHCNSYQNKRFNNKDEVICNGCEDYYTIDKTNNICLECPSHCTRCHFDLNSNSFLCDACADDYVISIDKLCEPCANNEMIGGVGCIHCRYDGYKNKCIYCRDDYILIINDDVCKLPSEVNLNVTCFQAIRLDNDQYSCINCRNVSYTLVTRFNNTSDSYPAEKELVNCALGYEDEYVNLNCTNCLYN